MAFFTHYWTPEGPSAFRRGQAIENASGNSFIKSGMASGDTLYIVSIRQGTLLLWGRFLVDTITTDRREAKARLGHDPWDADEHVLGIAHSGIPYDPAREVSLEITRGLRFLSDSGPKSLAFRTPNKLDGQTLRGVRKIFSESAALLDTVIRDATDQPRNIITMEQVVSAYETAVRVYHGQMPIEEGARQLHRDHDLNVNSARDFINDYRSLIDGLLFQRAMSAPAMEYFLGRILRENGIAALARSLNALRLHIEYYEKIRSVTLHRMRQVANSFEAVLDSPIPITNLESDFSKRLQEANRDAAARRARLKSANGMPARVNATISVFIRNADVVAEVLERAMGICELCTKPAPFSRKSDGSPYLEVHHRKQLSQGGEDTVENAVAVCPNCHRQSHYG